MHFTPTWPVLASALVAAAGLAAAPTAAAAPAPLTKVCLATIAATTCRSPGNVEITGSTPTIDFYPYGTMPFLLGGN